MLEDLGFYCIDNMPAQLLKPFILHAVRSKESAYDRTAVGLDARNAAHEVALVPELIAELKRSGISCEVVFLTAGDEELLRRFAETKRSHPLSRDGTGLREAIALERRLLEPMINAADMVLDTSRMGVHELRDLIQKRVERREPGRLSIMFESFGYKYGLPGDADFVFDARTLPNPYWDPLLRNLTGRDADVVRYLEAQPSVRRFLDDIIAFIDVRIREHQAGNRSYLTIAIGCTGGQHRSVYLVEMLVQHFSARYPAVAARHSALK
jgi:UPF0042 nucleotide-binding protein